MLMKRTVLVRSIETVNHRFYATQYLQHSAPAAIDRYLLPAWRSVANPLAAAAAVD